MHRWLRYAESRRSAASVSTAAPPKFLSAESLARLWLIYTDGKHWQGPAPGPRPDLGGASKHLATLTRVQRLSLRCWSLDDDQLGFLNDLPALEHDSPEGSQMRLPGGDGRQIASQPDNDQTMKGKKGHSTFARIPRPVDRRSSCVQRCLGNCRSNDSQHDEPAVQ